MAATALRLTAVSFYCVGLWLLFAHTRYWIAFSFVAAGAMGNLLGRVVPPFKVVDFVYIKPINRLFGMEVVNLADLALVLGTVGVGLTALIHLFQRLAEPPKRKKGRRHIVLRIPRGK